ncbi:hypothetical protein SAMN05444392_103186 [Seinonella peptonophila]|uniref:Uncharacterized protein n=1 Tax=Seinonella peptonophila TaxID=112248 RepID=A0A1M4WEU4_9BACL|nr:hypothetical protein [Seinonella peptonophila]SHE79680.1 hypothetical protein SAMN05444392_103186 [Seinonella peptonophila]
MKPSDGKLQTRLDGQLSPSIESNERQSAVDNLEAIIERYELEMEAYLPDDLKGLVGKWSNVDNLEATIERYEREMEAYLPNDLKGLVGEWSKREEMKAMSEVEEEFAETLALYEKAKEEGNPALFDQYLWEEIFPELQSIVAQPNKTRLKNGRSTPSNHTLTKGFRDRLNKAKGYGIDKLGLTKPKEDRGR